MQKMGTYLLFYSIQEQLYNFSDQDQQSDIIASLHYRRDNKYMFY